MLSQLGFALVVATCFSLTVASQGEGVKGKENTKCERAVPLPPWASSYRGKCTYVCKGWPIRVENEPDGIACGLVTIKPRKRICKAGQCVRAHLVTDFPTSKTTLIPGVFTKQ